MIQEDVDNRLQTSRLSKTDKIDEQFSRLFDRAGSELVAQVNEGRDQYNLIDLAPIDELIDDTGNENRATIEQAVAQHYQDSYALNTFLFEAALGLAYVTALPGPSLALSMATVALTGVTIAELVQKHIDALFLALDQNLRRRKRRFTTDSVLDDLDDALTKARNNMLRVMENEAERVENAARQSGLEEGLIAEAAESAASELMYAGVSEGRAVELQQLAKEVRAIREQQDELLEEARELYGDEATDDLLAIAAEKNTRKYWFTQRDERVRMDHRKLHRKPADERGLFHVSGASAYFPKGFGRPDLDINCRCKIRWLVYNNEPERDSDELRAWREGKNEGVSA